MRGKTNVARVTVKFYTEVSAAGPFHIRAVPRAVSARLYLTRHCEAKQTGNKVLGDQQRLQLNYTTPYCSPRGASARSASQQITRIFRRIRNPAERQLKSLRPSA
jgi:hypothetical protein